MKRYPANHRAYDETTGDRLKFMEHGQGLLPSYLYPTVIEAAQEQLRFWEAMAKQSGDEYFDKRVYNAKRKITRLRRKQARAQKWDASRDAAEAAGKFH